ncbi:UbiX family flavin prenyltransferase [Alkalihalobacillus oceani]|uniref:UbiX family flavin prenyltransferase n=1 Tax=Halalkalibacter oceani TaxID=1653776 RepID=UPI00203CA79A|nr:UbiX family flavin prenyltransferase [Halalkalibacter oceani]MCM3760067.1 UbiX family flavin prenyltransferase [Halalkalibacter oceani]
MKKIVVGISGASGAIYGIRTLEVLQKLGIESHAVISNAAKQTIEYETDYTVEDVRALATSVYGQEEIGAAISSGSFKVDGMIVAPCSIKTLSAIANSFNDELITRAADVQLKERRKLVLIVRETPFNLSHLQHMTLITQMGGVILPPVPSFYHKPKTIDDLVNQTIGKALDQFDIDARLFRRWDGE